MVFAEYHVQRAVHERPEPNIRLTLLSKNDEKKQAQAV